MDATAPSDSGGKTIFGVEPATLLHGMLLMVMTFAAYMPAILYGGYIWDDIVHIPQNGMLHADDALYKMWCTLEFPQFYPMQLFTHWVEMKLFGINAAQMHAVNVLLHGLVGVLVWRVLRRLNFPLPWLAAAIFLLHPVNAETAAWLTERRNLLAAFFYLSSLLCWLRSEHEGRRWYAASFVFFLAAMWSKTISCSLPVIILLLSWMREKSFGEWRRDALMMLPYFAVGLPLGLLTAAMERYIIGAYEYEWSFSFAERTLICARALWFYAGKIVWPVDFMFHGYPRWNINPSEPAQWAWVAAAVLLIGALVPLARKFGRAAAVPLLFFGMTLFPASGFSNIYPQRFSFVADHFQYLASLGMICMLLLIGHHLFTRVAEIKIPAAAWRAAAALLLITLGTLSARRSLVYESNEIMWADVLSKNNDAWLAHLNYGVMLFNKGDREGALRHYREAKRCGPNDIENLYKLGDALVKLNRRDEARKELNDALAVSKAFEMVEKSKREDGQPLLCRTVRRLAGTPPNFLTIYQRINVTFTVDILLLLAELDAKEQPEAAFKHIERAIELAPQMARPYIVRGEIHEGAGRLNEALADYTRAADLAIKLGEGFCRKGDLLMKMGRRPEAHTAYREAIKREPTHAGALARLAALAVDDGKLNEAVTLYTLLVALNPEDGESQLKLGILMASAGRFKEALEHLQLARAATPKQAEVYVNLAQVHVASRDVPAAAAVLREGLIATGAGAGAATSPAALRLNDSLAWLLATAPQDAVRDGKEAVKLAKLVVEQDPQNARAYDTLAAAHAETGDFDAAVALGVRALELAEKARQGVLAEKIAERIKLYESRKPFRQ